MRFGMRQRWIAVALATGVFGTLAAESPATGARGIGERARTLLVGGQVQDAEKLARTGLAGGPDDGLLCLMGEIQFRRGDFDKAASAFIETARRNPEYARAWWGMG